MTKGKATAPATRQQAEALRKAGASYSRITQETGVPTSTLSLWFGKVTPRNEPEFTPDSERRVTVTMDAETASRVMAKRPDLEAGMVASNIINAESLKSRLLRQVCEGGPYPDVPALMADVRRNGTGGNNYGAHEVTHLLYSLSKQGLVSYRTNRSRGPQLLEDIVATTLGRKKAGFSDKDPLPLETRTSPRPAGYSRKHHAVGTDYTEERNHGSTAVGGPVTHEFATISLGTVSAVATGTIIPAPEPTQDVPGQPEPEAPAPVAEPRVWPLLEGIRHRLLASEAAHKRASAYYDAALALLDVDPAQAAMLEQMGDAERGAPLTDLEQEYLDHVKYLEDCRK